MPYVFTLHHMRYSVTHTGFTWLRLCQDSTEGAGGKGSRAGGQGLAPAAGRCGKRGCLRAANCPPLFIKSSIGVWQMSLSHVLPGWEVRFLPPPPIAPFPSLPPGPAAGRGMAGRGTEGCARERVAMGLGGPRQGCQLVMPDGGVLTQPTACLGTFADRAISSLAPLVIF